MGFYTVRRLYTSLLAVCVPGAVAALAWVLFLGGRAVVAELAVAYLLIVIAGRAQAAHRELRERPHRHLRVRNQLERVRASLPDTSS